MPTLRFVHCDVFTCQAFGGNPLAVFPEAPPLDAARMQAIARELNLSETVFVLPPDDLSPALRRLRIFTPGMELPMAGHPVIGAWWVLAEEGVVPAPAGGSGRVELTQQLEVGLLPVTVEMRNGKPTRVIMTQSTPVIGAPLERHAEVAAALGLEPSDLARNRLPLVVASTGVPILLAELKDRETLGRARPQQATLDWVLADVDAICLYAVSRESDAHVHTRMFGSSALGIVEDPATGSAAGPLGAALLHFGLAPELGHLQIDQGYDMGRPSRIEVEAVGRRGQVSSVRVAGSAVTMIRGELSW